MKLILHIGSGKTGTTSIQNFFVRNAEKLEKLGVLYPVKKSVAANHILLAAGFVNYNSIPIPHNRFYLDDYEKYKNDFIRFKRALDSDIKRVKPDVLVLSAEQLFRDFSENSEISLSDFLEPYFDEIKVVAYVREPIGDYASRMSQRMRTGVKIFPPHVRNIRRVLEYYESQFPGCVHVNAFERNQLIDGDVVVDFVSKYIPSVLNILKTNMLPSYNESLPTHLLFKLYEERLAFQPDGNRPNIDTVALISAMSRSYAESQPLEKNSKLKLKPQVEAYLQASAMDYLWLRSKYGVIFSNLDYEQIKLPQQCLDSRTNLSDIVVMDGFVTKSLDSIVPSILKICTIIRTRRFILYSQLIRFYRIFIAYSWLGKLKRKIFR